MSDQNGFGEWGGYMEAKITKLEEQFTAASAPFQKSNLFAGISIYVNGLTNPSSDELKRIMMVHGGTYHHYERSHTTYIIASNLPDVKVRNMNTSKIISAMWVVDCVHAKRLLDYSPYLLYTNQKTSQPCINFGKSKRKDEEKPTPKSKTAEVAAIMEDLEKLNAQMRESAPNELGNENAAGTVKAELEVKANKELPKTNTTTNAARTAVDPNFLPEFFNNSRLHHIATLGAGFKQYVNELREKHEETCGFPARLNLLEKLRAEGDITPSVGGSNLSLVMHIDMDCFFVSVGLRKHPHLRGQPVAVTHSKGGPGASDVPVHPNADREAEMQLFAKRFEQHLHNNVLSDKVRAGFDAKMSLSEIASCSYEARAKGIRNGMFVGQALKLCPNLKTIPYDFEGYREVAFTLYDTIAQYTLCIEAVSCDEMFVDLSEAIKELKIPPMDFVRAVRAEVREKTGCPCSAGLGANKLQARMATKHAKPDGQYYLEVGNAEEYMANIRAEELPGVGSSTNYILKEAGFITCGDLQRLTLVKLQNLVGKKHGETLYQFCRGVDNRPLVYEQLRKSVSAEVNYGIRFKEYAELETFLRQLCNEVHTRLGQINRKTKSITLKVMVRAKEAPIETSKFMGHGVCDNITKSVALNDFTNDLDVVTRTVLSTMKNLNLPPHELRGIGIQLTKLNQPKENREPKDNALKNMFQKIKKKQKELPITSDSVDEFPDAIASSAESTNTKPSSNSQIQLPSQKRAPSVIGMLQNAAQTKRQKQTNDSSHESDGNTCKDTKLLPNYIDAEVFAALPMDIRAEILRDIAPSAGKSNQSTKLPQVDIDIDVQPSTSRAAMERQFKEMQSNAIPTKHPQIDENFLQALPTDLRREIEADINSMTKCDRKDIPSVPEAVPTESNVFLQSNCNSLLLEWVNSDDAPSACDVELCCAHARSMVEANRLVSLYGSLIYFRKIIQSKHSTSADSAWYKAYCSIMKGVDEELAKRYPNRKLLTPEVKLIHS